MAIKKGDFITLDFTGRNQDGDVFDTTIERVAREAGLQTKRNVPFEPISICVGQGFVLPGLDEALTGKDVEGTFTVTLSPEEAFGKKRADMIKLMPLKVFKKQGVRPVVGLDLDIDGMHGVVKSVTGNRVVVDFNHPMASQEVSYEVTTRGLVEDLKTQAEILISRSLRFTPKLELKEKNVTVFTPFELPEDLTRELSKYVVDNSEVKAVDFVNEAAEKSE